MKQLTNISVAHRWRETVSGSLGFVPTMGALHQGHLALVREAQRHCDRVVVSIYVNPLQFNNAKDLRGYPRTLDEDLALLEPLDVDAVFVPMNLESEGTSTKMMNSFLGTHWCGAGRPGHFEGVLVVVSKLFNILQPTDAWFGLKDYQQFCIVRTWAKELFVPVKVHSHAIVRDSDGLALSSRNRLLAPEDRLRALAIPRALEAVGEAFRCREARVSQLMDIGAKLLKGVEVEYFDIADPDTLQPVAQARSGSVVLLAANVGSVRLIDNVILDTVK